MPAMELRICHLYPRLLNVAGDRGNLIAIERRCSWRGIRTAVTDVGPGQEHDLTGCDLILFHGGQDKEMDVVAEDLRRHHQALRAAAKEDVVILGICAGYQLLGHYYQPSRAPRLEGVGALDVVTEAGATRFMNHISLRCDFPGQPTHTMVGFENHSGRTFLGSKARALGTVLAGSGNNGEDGFEGARQRQVYGTYLHGPLLPKNPWFTDHLIWQGLRHRYGEIAELDPLDNDSEDAAHQAALELAVRNRGKLTAVQPTVWSS